MSRLLELLADDPNLPFLLHWPGQRSEWTAVGTFDAGAYRQALERSSEPLDVSLREAIAEGRVSYVVELW